MSSGDDWSVSQGAMLEYELSELSWGPSVLGMQQGVDPEPDLRRRERDCEFRDVGASQGPKEI